MVRVRVRFRFRVRVRVRARFIVVVRVRVIPYPTLTTTNRRRAILTNQRRVSQTYPIIKKTGSNNKQGLLDTPDQHGGAGPGAPHLWAPSAG